MKIFIKITWKSSCKFDNQCDYCHQMLAKCQTDWSLAGEATHKIHFQLHTLSPIFTHVPCGQSWLLLFLVDADLFPRSFHLPPASVPPHRLVVGDLWVRSCKCKELPAPFDSDQNLIRKCSPVLSQFAMIHKIHDISQIYKFMFHQKQQQARSSGQLTDLEFRVTTISLKIQEPVQ